MEMLANMVIWDIVIKHVILIDKIFDVYSNICRGPQKIRKIVCRTNAHLNYFGNGVSVNRNSLPINVTSLYVNQ